MFVNLRHKLARHNIILCFLCMLLLLINGMLSFALTDDALIHEGDTFESLDVKDADDAAVKLPGGSVHMAVDGVYLYFIGARGEEIIRFES